MSDDEKTSRITTVADDIAASIIYIAKQAEAGNLTAQNTSPIYDLIDSISLTEKKHRRRLERELERQDHKMAEMGQRHRESLYEVMTCANIAVSQLKARADRLDAELARLRGKRVAAGMLDAGGIEKMERNEEETAGKLGA
jgi:peroxiredoxin